MGKHRITIGTDPEFVAIKNGNTINAEEFPFRDSYSSAFGGDGTPFELRPGFSTDTIYLVHRIRMILKHGIELIPGLKRCKLIAGHFAGGQSLGGHIHIGSNPFPDNIIDPLVTLLGKVLIDGLDGFLSTKKHNEMRRVRRNRSYGGKDDYRMDWGSTHTHFEYRAPCSFLASPKAAFLNLSLAKVCAIATFRRMNIDRILSATTPKGILREVVTLIKSSKKFSCEDIKLTRGLLEGALKNKSSIRVQWYSDFKKRWRI